MGDLEKRRFGIALFSAGFFTAITWLIFFLTHFLHPELILPGIIPGELRYVYGILLSPVLHGSWSHIFSNTLPLFLLLSLLIYSYRGIAFFVFASCWLLTGILTWFTGEAGTNHIGASGIIYAMASFLFFSGLLRWEKGLLFISATVIFLYGSMIWGILPLEPGISWEGHLSGAVTGTALAFFFRKKGPVPMKEKNLDDEEHVLDEYSARQKLRDGISPADPHYHQDPHQQKKYTHYGPHKRIT